MLITKSPGTLGALGTLTVSAGFFHSPSLGLGQKRRASPTAYHLRPPEDGGWTIFTFSKPDLERGPVTAVVTAEHLVTGVVWMLVDGKSY